ncbi:hypothetical protein [Tuberibacillus sp. Marseille-P3662]|uniref:hypothetical protein n=1 Tax=Tuberibacillus sp. Marseille-P3662 TaxID=1965358 RepID=UPI000A1C7EEE|nr:hypothetical protein [Tuberibacillus sp. Marseille-P3662]
MPITEEQLTVLHQYQDLINTVEQAFIYIKNRAFDDQMDAARQMLPDIMAALMQINQSHQLLSDWFESNEALQTAITTFNNFVSRLNQASGVQPEILHERVLSELSPRFLSWKRNVEAQLISYTQQ